MTSQIKCCLVAIADQTRQSAQDITQTRRLVFPSQTARVNKIRLYLLLQIPSASTLLSTAMSPSAVKIGFED